jgi:ribosomal protein S18 acetylase RimI-like enzyme
MEIELRPLGKALLLHSFRELRRRGCARARLLVDGENLTGAVRLYEGAGMHVARRFERYWKELA